MAERRSFSAHIVESDAFLDMTLPAQALYFHLCVNAKDKGFLNNVYTIAKIIGCNACAIEELRDRGFIKPTYESEIYDWEIVHWYENNGIGETAKKRNNYKYRQWRQAVIERDKKCRACGVDENLQAHHIKPFAKFPLLRFDINNGITMCERCHREYHRKERENGRC